MECVLLLDGYNLIFRSYYAVPNLTRSDGFPSGAIHGWVRTIFYLADFKKPCRLIAFFDLGGATAREALQADYKANRTEMPEDLSPQVPVIKELTRFAGIPVVEKEGVEADDLMAAHALRLADDGCDTWLVSADKDLAQVLRPNIRQLLPAPTANPKLGWRELTAESVPEKFGVRPDQIADYLALVGDTSDNIPGLKGVGPKTAANWLKAYGTLEAVLDNAGQLKPLRFQSLVHENADRLRVNRQMTTLDLSHASEPVPPQPADPDALVRKLDELEMKTAARDAAKRFAADT